MCSSPWPTPHRTPPRFNNKIEAGAAELKVEKTRLEAVIRELER